MSKFALFNSSGELTARYDSAIHGEPLIECVATDPDSGETLDRWTEPNPDCKIPAVAVEVSDELFHQTINEPDGLWKRDPVTGDIVKHPLPAPSLESIKATKAAEINAACTFAIVGGFTSSALGAPHTYDSALEDQLNLIGAVGLSIDLPYRCTDAAGVKAFRVHTSAQLKQVAADGALVKLTALEKAATLKAQVQAATDAAAVEAAAW